MKILTDFFDLMPENPIKPEEGPVMARKTLFEEITGTANEILTQIRKLIREGSARRLLIRNKEGKTLLEVPLTAGVAGTALLTSMAPVVSAISMFALFLNDVTILVERYPESEEEEERMKNEAEGRKQKHKDDYEVDAEFITIQDDEEEEEEQKDKTVGSSGETKEDREEPFPADDEQPEKTVGKDNDEKQR